MGGAGACGGTCQLQSERSQCRRSLSVGRWGGEHKPSRQLQLLDCFGTEWWRERSISKLGTDISQINWMHCCLNAMSNYSSDHELSALSAAGGV